MVPALGRAAGAVALAGVLALALAQPLAADLRSASVLARTDTREAARAFLTERLRPSARVVIEPAVPSRYYRLVRKGRTISPRRKQFVRGFIRENRQSRLDYAAHARAADHRPLPAHGLLHGGDHEPAARARRARRGARTRWPTTRGSSASPG